MSDTARPKSTKDKLTVNEVNQDLPTTMTAGETIGGATTPVPLYIGSDGKVYACDSNDTSKLEFIGFGVSDGTDDNDITVQNHGVVSGFSGLTVGSKYYVQDDGSLGTTTGTYLILVGTAVSVSDILINKISGETLLFSASDNLKASADTERGGIITTYKSKKSIRVYKKGRVRVKFSIKEEAGGTTYGRIYIDGVAVGTERSNNTTTYIEFSEDIDVEVNSAVQLYIKNNTGYAYAKNFRIYYDVLPYGEIIVLAD